MEGRKEGGKEEVYTGMAAADAGCDRRLLPTRGDAECEHVLP